MTQKQAIIEIFDDPLKAYGCTSICTILWWKGNFCKEKWGGKNRIRLMASVSSQLRKLVKENILMLTPHRTGLRGGMVYTKYKK